MKTWWKQSVGGLVCLLAVMIIGPGVNLWARPLGFRSAPPSGVIPIFNSNPYALLVISNLLAAPAPALSVPEVSNQASHAPGTYWTLKGPAVPLPFDPYPDLPVYEVSTNRNFIIDDRSVDYQALSLLRQAENELLGLTNQPVSTYTFDTNGLWIQVPTNSLATPGYFNVNVMNTVLGQSYDILTTPDLLATWATALVVTGAVGNVTPVQLPMNTDGSLFVRVRTSVNYSFYVASPPLSQAVFDGDTVTFTVTTGGNPNLSFQWLFNGDPIAGATNRSYTITKAQDTDAGNYTVIISDGTNSLVTDAMLTTDNSFGTEIAYISLRSSRQDYTFRSGVTYSIRAMNGPIQLFGHTTIEAGAILKFDWYYNSSLQIMGTLTGQGEPYNPAILTSVDDDSVGYALGYSVYDGPPQPYETGVPYLELAAAQSNCLGNLRIEYADWGVTTPVAARRLDLWDCQFVQCNYGVVNLVDGSSTNHLHNVLFAACSAAVGAATNAVTIEGEQVTADVGDFCLASATPSRIALTNSIIWGNNPTATSLSTINVALNPDDTNFVYSGGGIYYLAANSPLHQSGTAGISPRLQRELRNKTTYAPMDIAAQTQISGAITLSPQAPRYTNGAPDLGYYYDALDYTVADLVLNGGTLTVLPGTAIGCRMEYVPGWQDWSYIGFDLQQNASVISQGTPAKPIIYADVQAVQEQVAWPVEGIFVPDFVPVNTGDQPPVLNFRFSNFYLNFASYVNSPAYHFWSGISFYGKEWSLDSLMYMTLQDCQLQGGQVDLGTPDNLDYGRGYYDYDFVYGSGAVTWVNNLFDHVTINLNMSYYWGNQVVNCDMQVRAYNNMFRGGWWLNLEPFPASAGNWLFKDNLFEKVNILQDTAQPLDYDNNGYWPLTAAEQLWVPDAGQLQPSSGGNVSGANDVVLTAAPPYAAGPFGKFYLSDVTPLYQAGSRTALDAGLSQYTTFTNQTKDASNAPVNIGLHYVAATNLISSNAYLPLDSDSDGVPDYVEVEHGTDPNNPMTDGVTPDAYNSAYDDVDLDGDGLSGRAERILGTNPLIQDNPLTLTPVITGQEPYILTYSMPLIVDLTTNHSVLRLLDNGSDAGAYDFVKQTNGTYLVEWNTTFASNGSHLLQVGLDMPGYVLPKDAGGAQPVLSVAGQTRVESINNPIQLDLDDTSFGSQALFTGTLSVSSADYEIDIFDTNNVLLKTIAGHTDSGTLNEVWGLTDTNGVTHNDEEFDAQLYITPTGTLNNSQTRVHANYSGGSSSSGPIPIWRFANGICGDEFSLAYGWNPDSSRRSDMIMDGVENIVFNPALDNDYFPSPLTFPGWYHTPFFMGDNTNDQATMLNDLANQSVGNFYWHGHGGYNNIGSGTGVGLAPSDVAIKLGNISFNHGNKNGHPYRLVILDACGCGEDKSLWVTAFGIVETNASAEWFQQHGLAQQAMVAWPGPIDSLGGSYQLDSHSAHLADFWAAWMAGLPLEECVGIGATPYDGVLPLFDRPLDPNWKIFGCPFMTRSP